MSGIVLGSEFRPLGFVQVNVTTSPATLVSLAARPPKARHVIMYPEDEIRFRFDGQNPAQASGLVMDADLHVYENQTTMVDNMRVISGTGSTVVLNIHWFA